jgi:hypothetical protein
MIEQDYAFGRHFINQSLYGYWPERSQQGYIGRQIYAPGVGAEDPSSVLAIAINMRKTVEVAH